MRSYRYFHGALLDEDANRLLRKNGDFLIQSCTDSNQRYKLTVMGNGRVFRFRFKKCDKGYEIMDKKFKHVKSMINYFKTHTIILKSGETIQLKRSIPKTQYELTHRDIYIREKIGSGSYGMVFKGKLKQQQVVAIKQIVPENNDLGRAIVDLMKEARVMLMYDHKNIVRFYGFVVDRDPYLLVMEFCEDGSVEDHLRIDGETLTTEWRVSMVTQAARGIEYLHNRHCIHRDIAARNCLLQGKTLKIADFGMCRAVPVYTVDLARPQNVRWLAPEVWRNGQTRYNTDIYAFGILLWEVFQKKYEIPYASWKAHEVKKRTTAGYRLPTPENMPKSIAVLMKECWNQDPQSRPLASQLRKQLEIINSELNGDETQITLADSKSTMSSETTASISPLSRNSMQTAKLSSQKTSGENSQAICPRSHSKKRMKIKRPIHRSPTTPTWMHLTSAMSNR